MTACPTAPEAPTAQRVRRHAAPPAPHAWKPVHGHGFREAGRAVLMGIGISAVVLAPGARIFYRDYSARLAADRLVQERYVAHDRLVAAQPGPVLALDAAVHGRGLFDSTCAACHKADGTGMPGLGKDLTASGFVAMLDDGALRAFVSAGRSADDALNTTRVPMPPKGGHPELTDADLADIVTYVRGLQDPRRMPDLPARVAVVPPPPTDEQKAQALAAAGGDEELAGYIAHGTTVFAATCAACHGKDGLGLPKLGKDLVHSAFLSKLDDDAALDFIKKGRDPGDPANTSGVAMPPKGGNPALSDDDLLDVIAYVRTIQQPSTTQ